MSNGFFYTPYNSPFPLGKGGLLAILAEGAWVALGCLNHRMDLFAHI